MRFVDLGVTGLEFSPSLSEIGIGPDAKEAMGFAVLANETLGGGPGNVPAATGARTGAVLGKISVGF